MDNWLESARVESGMTKTKLANIVGLDMSAIGKYERGERRPSVETAKKIAHVLGFDWKLFFPDDGEAGSG